MLTMFDETTIVLSHDCHTRSVTSLLLSLESQRDEVEHKLSKERAYFIETTPSSLILESPKTKRLNAGAQEQRSAFSSHFRCSSNI